MLLLWESEKRKRVRAALTRHKRKILRRTGVSDFLDKRNEIEARIELSREIAVEVTQKLAREFAEEVVEFKPIETMSQAEIDHQIGVLLYKKMKADEDEMILLLLIAASV